MEKFYDAIVVGGGPAGLSAAIYMARARFRVLVIEKEKVGGQITITAEVVNYPGIFSTNGEKLTAEMARQARAFGAEFLNAEVTGMDVDDDYKVVHTSNGDFKWESSLPAAHIRVLPVSREKMISAAMAWHTVQPAMANSLQERPFSL